VVRPDGTLAWSHNVSGAEADHATCVTTGSDGRVYVVGSILQGGQSKVRAWAYSRGGEPLWSGEWTSPAPALGAWPQSATRRGSKLWVGGASGGLGGTQDQLLLRWSTE
jgi:hypothetical protein